MQQLSDRVVADAFKARIEVGRLEPMDTQPSRSVCICGKTIEDRSCPTGGHCSRGIDANLTA
jgi:hypothetical protein